MKPPSEAKQLYLAIERWLILAAYAPSMILLVHIAPLLRRFSGDRAVLVGTLYVAAGALAPMLAIIAELAEKKGPVPAWVSNWRLGRMILVCNWMPHHVITLLLMFFVSISSDGMPVEPRIGR
jgi:chromate transport protein ChrA